MFFQLGSIDNKIEKTETALKEVTIRLEALQSEINKFLKECETSPQINDPYLNPFTPDDLKKLEELLKVHAEKLERNKKSSLEEARKKQSERNVGQHWLFVK